MLATIFALLVVYQLKHYVADFLLQGKYMLGKFKPGWDFVPPLAAHCAVHAIFTLMIVIAINPKLWWLSLVDFLVHFIMDRIKASPRMMGRWSSLSKDEYVKLLLEKARLMEIAPDGHVEIDKIDRRFRGNVFFWWSLGIDQMVHSLTHYFIIFMLVQDAPEEFWFTVVNTTLMVIMSPLAIPFLMLKGLIFCALLYKYVLKSNGL